MLLSVGSKVYFVSIIQWQMKVLKVKYAKREKMKRKLEAFSLVLQAFQSLHVLQVSNKEINAC